MLTGDNLLPFSYRSQRQQFGRCGPSQSARELIVTATWQSLRRDGFLLSQSHGLGGIQAHHHCFHDDLLEEPTAYAAALDGASR